MSWIPSLFGLNSAAPAMPPTATQGDSDRFGNLQDGPGFRTSNQDSRISEANLMPHEELHALLPYMPPLFSKDLPPCGLITQVAYENVVHRLRKVWLLCAKQNSSDISLLRMCKWVLEEYRIEAAVAPVGSEDRTKERKPWRREEVFRVEINWAMYFVREAETLAKRASMTEKEKEQQDYILDFYPVPKELYIFVKYKANREELLAMWRAWQKKKRGPVPVLVSHASSERVQDEEDEGKEGGCKDDEGVGNLHT